MPQTDGATIKSRAARLRAAGQDAARRHLAALAGTRQRILTEGPRIGRTECFAEVAFDHDMPEGTLIDTVIRGHDGTRLTA
jgi:threonylcarbamoyladenosine tRNA methylthiotransferase MtaB